MGTNVGLSHPCWKSTLAKLDKKYHHKRKAKKKEENQDRKCEKTGVIWVEEEMERGRGATSIWSKETKPNKRRKV